MYTSMVYNNHKWQATSINVQTLVDILEVKCLLKLQMLNILHDIMVFSEIQLQLSGAIWSAKQFMYIS